MTSKAFNNLVKLRNIVSISDFGADPTGVADSSTAFQAALESFSTSQTAYIIIPPGEYRIASKITINKPTIIQGMGGRLIGAVANNYVFEVSDTDSTYPDDYEFNNVQIKWSGNFGASTCGGIHIASGVNVKITNCEFWGLGLNAIKLTNIICGVIEKNHIKEHLNKNEIIRAVGVEYLITIRDNFFQFTAPAKTKPCVYMQQVFNLDISNNALEIGSHGLYLQQFGRMYGGSIRNNFFEGCTIGLALGNDNGDKYFGAFRGVTIENNVFTANVTSVLIAGACEQVEISNNLFESDVVGAIGINVTSKGYNSLKIGANDWLDNMALANRVQGYAYPFGDSSIEGTKVVVDRTDTTSGWTEVFDPSGFGTIATAPAMPGVNATNSLQLSFTSTPTNQFIVQKTVSTVDLSNSDFLVVPFWVDDPSKLYSTQIEDWRILGIGPDSSNYWGFNIGEWSDWRTIVINKGWNVMVFPKADAFVVAGTPTSWSAITYIQLRIVPDFATAPLVTTRFNGIYGMKLHGTSAFSASQLL